MYPGDRALLDLVDEHRTLPQRAAEERNEEDDCAEEDSPQPLDRARGGIEQCFCSHADCTVVIGKEAAEVRVFDGSGRRRER